MAGLLSGISSNKLDLSTIAFHGDAALRELLLAEEAVVAVAEEQASMPWRPRSVMLRSAVRLTKEMAPAPYATLARVTDALGVTARVELYCEQSPVLNAYVWPPEGDRVVVVLTNQLLERLDEGELAFVLGHELGHVLAGHGGMPHLSLEDAHGRLDPLSAMRLFSWSRYAEMTADRFGLIGCGDLDAAIRVAFKLASGLADTRVVADIAATRTQFDELVAEGMDPMAEDWFATHPYGPLRLRALELFARSHLYATATGTGGGELGDEDLAREYQRIVAMMDPVVLHEDLACRDAVKRFLLLAGGIVAASDGSADQVELDVLVRFARGEGATQGQTRDAVDAASTFGDTLRGLWSELTTEDTSEQDAQAAVDAARTLPAEELWAKLEAEAATLRDQLFPLRRHKLVEDLVGVAMADARVDQAEIVALVRIARSLGVEPRFVHDAIDRARSGLDLR